MALPQKFDITLKGVVYGFRLKWNAISDCWILDILDAAGADLCCGIPLVTGTDLLGQFEYLGIGGSLVVQTDGDPDAIPTFESLGDNGRIYFVAAPQ